jgi:aryl-alcohol dehydrogenase-like predicted oxidoreductase
VVFSPWHLTAVPKDERAPHFPAVLEPLAQKYSATVQQIALAWQLHRSPVMLPIPGTTSVDHLKENLAAAAIRLTPEEVEVLTQLVPEGKEP